MPGLSVVVVDDSLLLRAGITSVLGEAGFDVVAEFPDATGLLDAVGRLQPDVVVLDIQMPPTRTDEGVRAALSIRRQWPAVGTVLLTAFAEPEYVRTMLADGADGVGYLLKERVGDLEGFAAAVRTVARGGTALDPAVVGLLVAGAAAGAERDGVSAAATDMDSLMLGHAAAWAREHGYGVAREVRDGFVAVMPDGRHTRHRHFYEALEWLEAQELGPNGDPQNLAPR
jgi:DNA-binding NarL/FixJ family response regulator